MGDGPVREGEILAGKYRVERVLGMGGMGVVVAAHHLQLDERVALKFLLPAAAESGEVVARFAREARAAAKIKSEHVARVTDVGALDNGAPYLVMEFLNGKDLAELLKQRGPLPIAEAVDYVLQASEAVAEAHSLGIVHRDLKPGNLFLTRRRDGSPCVKVLDFGISKMAGLTGAPDSMTATNTMMGSPLYMSPEQMLSAKDVDLRSDIWSLGVILYELLSGVTPFTGETITHVVLYVAREPPRPLRSVNPELPAALERVVLRCLEKDVRRRFQHVGELARALLEFGPEQAHVSVGRISRMMAEAGIPGSPAPTWTSEAEERSLGTATAGAWGKTRGGSAPKRARVVLVLLAAVAGLGLGWLGWRQSAPPPSVASAAELAVTPPPAHSIASALVVESPVVAPAPLSPPPAASPGRVASSSSASVPITQSSRPAGRPRTGPTRPTSTAVATAAPPTPTHPTPPSPVVPSPGKLDFGGRN